MSIFARADGFSNGYLTALGGGGGRVIVTGVPSDATTFRLEPVGVAQYAIRTSGDFYLSINGGGIMDATAASIGPSETFDLPRPSNPVRDFDRNIGFRGQFVAVWREPRDPYPYGPALRPDRNAPDRRTVFGFSQRLSESGVSLDCHPTMIDAQ